MNANKTYIINFLTGGAIVVAPTGEQAVISRIEDPTVISRIEDPTHVAPKFRLIKK